MTESDTYRASDGVDYCRVPIKISSCQQLPLRCAFYKTTPTGGYDCYERDIHGHYPCRDALVIFLTREQYLEHRLMGEA